MFGRRTFLHKLMAGSATGLVAASTAAGARGSGKEDALTPAKAGHKPLAPDARHPSGNVLDPAYVDARMDSRAVTFENPTGARGAGGKERDGRKGHAFHVFKPGEKAVLADLTGPGTIRHIWMTAALWRPEVMRSLRVEVFYDGLTEPSISVPLFDFFALPHGRMVEFYSALVSVNQGRGLNSVIPMPFARSLRMEFTNESDKFVALYYQLDYTLGATDNMNYLHVSFRRENPTVLRRDFVIADGLKGPGRFLGCSVGVRPIEKSSWFGEGEVKIYRDGDTDYPTICGTGLEDYVGTAYGLGRHHGPYAGAPLNYPDPDPKAEQMGSACPDFMSFYRWHLPDPVMFEKELRVTIQQIGSGLFMPGMEAAYTELRRKYPDSSLGWIADVPGILGFGFYERIDDYCATSFVYCRDAQPVPRYSTALARQDIALLPEEAAGRAYKYVDVQSDFNAEMLKRWKV